MSLFNTTSTLQLPEKRRPYSVYAGYNKVELGHLFTGATRKFSDEPTPEGMVVIGGLVLEKEDGLDGYVKIKKQPQLCVSINPALKAEWEKLMNASQSSQAGYICMTHDFMTKWEVFISNEALSDYTVAELHWEDVKALLTHANLPIPKNLTRIFDKKAS